MVEKLKQRLSWLAGIWTIWAAVWFLLGLRAIAGLRGTPHPFLEEVKLTGVMLRAVLQWAFSALQAHLFIGLLLGLLGQVALSLAAPKRDAQNLNFKGGLLLGLGSALWFHGVLFLLVPRALASIPLLKNLPAILGLGLPLVGGAFVLGHLVRRSHGGMAPLRWVAILGLSTGMIFIPHDSFRRMMPAPSTLPKDANRVVIVGLDALRQDVFEQIKPEWKAPGGCQPITVAPATRRIWNLIMGADPQKMERSLVIPELWELQHPEHLTLLKKAKDAGLRTAFVINDNSTLAFGLQPNLFTSVYEPDGGWKYYFSLGYGTCWPTYSWGQNYFSIVETSNAWADTEAYWRDLDRAMERHHWVSSHLVELHPPLILRLDELVAWRGWRWLWEAPLRYKSYTAVSEIKADGGNRLDWRADARVQYQIRSERLIKSLEPHLAQWEKKYTKLSGVIISDHGELHPRVRLTDDSPDVHIAGVHGFLLDPDTLRIAFHPFGRTLHNLDETQVWSLMDLRDSLAKWVAQSEPLFLTGQKLGSKARILAIQATHLEDSPGKQGSGLGLNPNDIASWVVFDPTGVWYVASTAAQHTLRGKFSTALVYPTHMVTFNPNAAGAWERTLFKQYTPMSTSLVTESEMAAEIKSFDALFSPQSSALNPKGRNS